jgi:hypothetical protein
MEKEIIRMAPPWIQYVNELKALFGRDPEISIQYDNDEYAVTLLVKNQTKADALTLLLPEEKVFGNVSLKVKVVPANMKMTEDELMRAAFNGNPALHDIVKRQATMQTPPFTYVIFKKEVVQYFNDELGDAHGNRSTLYQDIAKDLFSGIEGANGVFFCTDNGAENVGKPLGEWP